MTQGQHPITPPPWLVEQWMRVNDFDIAPLHLAQTLTTQAARWGADMELEACCLELIDGVGRLHAEFSSCLASDLRAARRPKQPSLKEQALEELETMRGDLNAHGLGFDAPAIRRALEALPDD